MANRDRFNAASVDLGKIRRVIYRKCDNYGDELIFRNGKLKQIVRAVSDRDKLEHERSAAQDGYDGAGYGRDDFDFAHSEQSNDHAEGKRKQQRQEKYRAGAAHAVEHCLEHCNKIHRISSF